MLQRLRVPAAIIVALLLGAGGWYQFAGQNVPSEQTPLTTLGAVSLDPARDAFNRAADRVRVVLLLSPT